MPVKLTDEFFEVMAEGEEVMLMSSRIIYAGMCVFARKGMLYDKEEIYQKLKHQLGIDYNLSEFNLLPLSRFCEIHSASKKVALTSLQNVLRNLWFNGMIRKYATGTHGMSGRPMGVHWRIK